MGAWLGHKFGGRWLTAAAAAAGLNLPAWVLEWGPVAAGAVLATLAGVFLGRPLNFLLGWSFRKFNEYFDRSTATYTRLVGALLRVSAVAVLLYGGLLALTWWGFTHAPSGFIPQQDKGYLLVNVQLPDAASVRRTQDVVQRIEKMALDTPGVKHTVAIAG